MIKINEGKLEFHLYTENSSYIMKVLPSGHLVNLHYGPNITHRDDFSALYHNYEIPVGCTTAYSTDNDNFTLETTKLEISTYGKGDYRDPSLHIKFEDNSRVSDFKYNSHSVSKGKKPLEGLPHTYGDEDAETLIIKLYDEVKDVYIILSFSVFYDRDVFTRDMVIENGNQGDITLKKVMSLNSDFSESDFELITIEGKWIREGQINQRKLSKGITSIDSKKGVSGSNHNPFIALKRNNTTEEQGECYGYALVYSGNHLGQVEVSPHNFTRVQMGINPFDFSWTLKKGELFQTPEVIMTYSKSGLNGMSKNFHNIINNNLVPKKWQYKERPVLFNNWEATYFDFNEKKLVELAKSSKELGIELFVLDDGWFGNRNSDKTGLGDLFVNKTKLPGGLTGLCKKINKMDMDFGLWVEPEMISVESELYKEHPEWAVKLNDRTPSFGRNQLLLDLANPEVVEYLYTALSTILKESNIKYIKWDMNRNMSDFYSNYLTVDQQEEFNHRYVLGLYDLLGRLTTEFDEVLFEGCCSGGNRFDAGILFYMPQIWTSDNTDALERTSIQYGMSLLYPLSTMGAHVSGEPSHQVLRTTPLESRFNVAAFGVLGYEMDVTKLSDYEKKVIKKQISYYKEHRSLFQFGEFTRLLSPFENNNTHWMVTNSDSSQVILGYYQKLQEANGGLETIKIPNLIVDKKYTVENREQFINIRHFGSLVNEELPINVKANGVIHSLISSRYMQSQEKMVSEFYGDQLVNIGLPLYNQFMGTGLTDKVRFIGDFGSRLYKFY